MAQTTKSNMFDPQVLKDMIQEKIDSQFKLTPYIKVNNKLKGQPGSTITVPIWKYIGMADHYSEGQQLQYSQLANDTKTFSVSKAGKGVQITTEAIQAGIGKPKDTAVRQVALAIHDRWEQDGIDACYSHTIFTPATLAKISYAYCVKMNAQLANENNGEKKVLFINPAQEEDMLNETLFHSSDTYQPGVVLNGAIGRVAGADVKKSNRIRKVEYEKVASGTSGAKAVVADSSYSAGTNLRVSDCTNNVWDGTNKIITTAAVGDYVKAVAQPYYLNVLIQIDSVENKTEYSDDELAALMAFPKDDIDVTVEFDKDHDQWEIAAWQHYGVAMCDESKVVVTKTLA